MQPNKEEIQDFFKSLQDDICTRLTALDGKGVFKEDLWQHEHGGGGRSRVILEGDVIIKGGVNFSAVFGPMPEKILAALKLPPNDYFASGVSIVLHSRNPHVPIIHMNVRYFEMADGTYWFGGGIDLTPHYIDKEAAKSFHTHLKKACDLHSEHYYPAFKKWADDYFYIPHRNETRGIGGIFFDRLNDEEGFDKRSRFDFVKEVGNTFVNAYSEQVNLFRNLPYNDADLQWQKIRRSRYAEFNLVYDRGTKFGLDTNGRIESILMSMPPEASWVYDYKAVEGSKEEATLNLLKKGIEWV